ncbi:MAG TPA: RecX family transcriptional regulator [Bacilli bacterium]|nr:RecX family transcriptional regulator [Bacilli bacterium]
MQINSYKKLKGNLYEVTIDDLKVKLYDDIIIKYNLLLKKDLTEKKFQQIIADNDSLTAYYRALKYINVKLRSEKEIYNYLKRLDINYDTILATIDKLKKDGYLDHNIYLKSYINDQLKFSNHGPFRIKNNLLNLGFKENEIDLYLNKIDKSIWEEKIKKVLTKRKKLNKNTKEKNYIYLFNLGYEKQMIYSLLGDIEMY